MGNAQDIRASSESVASSSKEMRRLHISPSLRSFSQPSDHSSGRSSLLPICPLDCFDAPTRPSWASPPVQARACQRLQLTALFTSQPLNTLAPTPVQDPRSPGCSTNCRINVSSHPGPRSTVPIRPPGSWSRPLIRPSAKIASTIPDPPGSPPHLSHAARAGGFAGGGAPGGSGKGGTHAGG